MEGGKNRDQPCTVKHTLPFLWEIFPLEELKRELKVVQQLSADVVVKNTKWIASKRV